MGTQPTSRNTTESNKTTSTRSPPPVIYPKLSIIGIRVDSILLLIVGITIIAMQVSVLVVYSNVFGEAAANDGNGTKPWWAPLYNWWCVSSGIVNLLIGFYGCFINSNRSQTWRLGWGLIMSLVALIVSLGAALLASVQTVRLSAVFDAANSTKSIQDQPSHPCASLVKENSLTEGDCLVWFGLEATVASLSALSVILCAVMALLIIIGLCSSTPTSSSDTTYSDTHEMKHTVVHRQQYNQHDIKGATGLSPLPPSIGVAVTEPPKQEVEQRPQENPEPEKPQDEVEAYASRLREMSEEELERHLQLRLQRAFVLELRRELDRRQRRRNMNSMQSETISEDPGQRESQAKS